MAFRLTGINFNRISHSAEQRWLRETRKSGCAGLSLLLHTRENNPAREYRFVSNAPDNNIIPDCSSPRGHKLGLYSNRARGFSRKEPFPSLFMNPPDQTRCFMSVTAKSFSNQKTSLSIVKHFKVKLFSQIISEWDALNIYPV